MLPVCVPFRGKYYDINYDEFRIGWRVPVICLSITKARNVLDFRISWGAYQIGESRAASEVKLEQGPLGKYQARDPSGKAA